jgi:hypothetical protein
MKSLVLYLFHEYNNRVNHFIKNAMFRDDDIHFMIICNNRDTQINALPCVKVMYRDNIGYDFGGWSEALFTNDLYKEYDRFLFVNSSTIGPFIPTYYARKWPNIFFDKLGKKNIKLFGSTINTFGDARNNSHIQSYVFSMTRETLEYLINCEIFSLTNIANSMHEAIYNKEILMSRKIIEAGGNIGCLMRQYKDVDFTFKTKSPEEYGINFFGCPYDPNTYSSLVWTPHELVLPKGNRCIPCPLMNSV